MYVAKTPSFIKIKSGGAGIVVFWEILTYKASANQKNRKGANE